MPARSTEEAPRSSASASASPTEVGPDGCPTDPSDADYDYCTVHAAPPITFAVDIQPSLRPLRPGDDFRLLVTSECGVLGAGLVVAGQQPNAVELVEARPASIGSVYRFYAIGTVPADATDGNLTLSAASECGRIEDGGYDEMILPIDGR